MDSHFPNTFRWHVLHTCDYETFNVFSSMNGTPCIAHPSKEEHFHQCSIVEQMYQEKAQNTLLKNPNYDAMTAGIRNLFTNLHDKLKFIRTGGFSCFMLVSCMDTFYLSTFGGFEGYIYRDNDIVYRSEFTHTTETFETTDATTFQISEEPPQIVLWNPSPKDKFMFVAPCEFWRYFTEDHTASVFLEAKSPIEGMRMLAREFYGTAALHGKAPPCSFLFIEFNTHLPKPKRCRCETSHDVLGQLLSTISFL